MRGINSSRCWDCPSPCSAHCLASEGKGTHLHTGTRVRHPGETNQGTANFSCSLNNPNDVCPWSRVGVVKPHSWKGATPQSVLRHRAGDKDTQHLFPRPSRQAELWNRHPSSCFVRSLVLEEVRLSTLKVPLSTLKIFRFPEALQDPDASEAKVSIKFINMQIA